MKDHIIEVPAWSTAPVRIREPSLGELLELLDRRLAPTPFLADLVGACLVPEGEDVPIGRERLLAETPASSLAGFTALGRATMRTCGLPVPEDPPPDP